jgi:hypothetical protein
MADRLHNLRRWSVVNRLAVLCTVTMAAYAVTVPVAVCLGGPTAWAADTLAAGLCLAGTAMALVLADRLQGPGGVLAALWLGMAFRAGVPFVIGIAIHLHGGPLAQAGLLCYLLVFYPIVLAVGTILSLPPTNRQPTPAR